VCIAAIVTDDGSKEQQAACGRRPLNPT
jgi:hypothetical protein